MTEFYRVDVAEDGCEHCHACTFWTIVYKDETGEDIEIGTSWGDKELADDICDLMNDAFEAGLNHEPVDPTPVPPAPDAKDGSAVDRGGEP